MNSKLRSVSRAKRKEELALKREGEALGLGFPLLPASCVSKNEENSEFEFGTNEKAKVKKRCRLDRLARDPFLTAVGYGEFGDQKHSRNSIDSAVVVNSKRKKRKKLESEPKNK
jgi:hypothetical protein